MIHAVIIDDEKSGIKSLELLLNKFTDDVKIVASTTNPEEGIELINRYRPDIVFLDIYMPQINGFELLDKLTFKGFHLIFTTAHNEHGLQALKANAFDYLLKPIDWQELKIAVDKVREEIKKNFKVPELMATIKDIFEKQNLKIMLPTKTGIEYVLADEIIYIEAHSNHCDIQLKNGNCLLVARSLKDYESQLCTENAVFFRIHNSFIVNINYVMRYVKEDGGYLTMSNNKHIPVSKNRKERFFKLLNLE